MQDAFPKARHGSVYAAQYAAFSFLRRAVLKEITFRRARSIWEGKAKRIDAEEADALKRAKIEETRREYQDLKSRIAAIETALAVAAEEAPGGTLDAHRKAPHALGNVDFP